MTRDPPHNDERERPNRRHLTAEQRTDPSATEFAGFRYHPPGLALLTSASRQRRRCHDRALTEEQVPTDRKRFDVDAMMDRSNRNMMCPQTGTAEPGKNSLIGGQILARWASGAEPCNSWCSHARSVVLNRTTGWCSKPQILSSERSGVRGVLSPRSLRR